MKVKYNNVLSKDNINDDNYNINLKIIKRNINFYDFFYNIMQNDGDYFQGDSFISYLASRKQLSAYVKTVKIFMVPTTTNDFFLYI